MYRYNEAVQRMIDWAEAGLKDRDKNLTLLNMSREVGYSPWYCSTMFHRICGVTLKSYVSRRRLTQAAIELRTTRQRILDISLEWGFSSQEAFTRAFKDEYGCTPANYRRNPQPIPLFMGKDVFHPWQYSAMHKTSQEGGSDMSKSELREAKVRMEYIPAHKYIGIWDKDATCYGTFWEHHDCDQVCGIIESMRDKSHPVVTPHTAGWYYVEKERRYFYGFGVLDNYEGSVPDGFEIRSLPGSYYLVFYHPPFDYMENNEEVMARVEELAWNFDLDKELPDQSGISTSARGGSRFQWNEKECQCYQRHYPEVIGYEVLRPVKLK